MASGNAHLAATADPRFEALHQALRQTRWNLALAALLLLGFVGGLVYLGYFIENKLQDRQEQILHEVRGQFLENVQPIMEKAGEEAVTEAAQPVADRFYDQFRADLPAYLLAMDRQGKKLTDRLSARMQQRVQAQYHASLVHYRAMLQKEFPEITDKATLDRMMNGFEHAFHRLIQRYYVDDFRKVTDETARLWKAVPPAPTPAGGVRKLEDELVKDLKDWLRYSIENSPAPRKPHVSLHPAAATAGKEGR